MTKYDCSSADINPIGGVSKVDLRKFILYCAERYRWTALNDIHSAPPTAELEPLKEGEIVQVDEVNIITRHQQTAVVNCNASVVTHVVSSQVDMGMTYEQLSRYGRLRRPGRCGPFSMFMALLPEWSDHMTAREVPALEAHIIYHICFFDVYLNYNYTIYVVMLKDICVLRLQIR